MLGVLLALAGPGARAQAAPRIAAIDWGIAQTLVALGVPPIAVGQIDDYETWVGGPPLPPGTREIGLRAQPNLELLAQLHPDLILTTRFYGGLDAKLAPIAPLKTVDIYYHDGPAWRNTVAATRELARIVHRPAAGRRLIERTEDTIAAAAERVPDHVPPLVVVQFMDAQHVRVYGHRSLVEATLTRMGLDNAWQGESTRWGFAQVPLQRLASVARGQLVVMAPIPVGVAETLAASALWRGLPVVRAHPVLFMPAVWSFGGLPSASRFAEQLANTLERAPDRGPGWPRRSAPAS